MKRGSTILNSRTGRTGASSAGLFDTEAFNTLRQTRGSTLLRFSCVKVSRLVRTVIRQVRMGTPYRLLCNDVQREDAKPSPDLASWLYSNVPLHKIRYGILNNTPHISESSGSHMRLLHTHSRGASQQTGRLLFYSSS